MTQLKFLQTKATRVTQTIRVLCKNYDPLHKQPVFIGMNDETVMDEPRMEENQRQVR